MRPFLFMLITVVVLTGCFAAFSFWGLGYSLKEISVSAAFVAALITSFTVIYQKAVKPMFIHATKVSTLILDVEVLLVDHKKMDFGRLVKDVEYIISDLKPNSGSSLRDAINRIESNLIMMERTIDALHQDGPVALFRCTPEGSNLEVNRTYCRLLKCTKGELEGYGWRNFADGKAKLADYDETWKESFAQGREIDFEIQLRTTDGELVTVDIHAYPIRDAASKVVQYLGLMHPKDKAEHHPEETV